MHRITSGVLGLTALALGLMALPPAAHAQQDVVAELLVSNRPLSLFATPDRQGGPVLEVPATEFPRNVTYLRTETGTGRMHLIRLEPDGPEYWAPGSTVDLKGVDSTVELVCEADQAASPGNVGRGVGARTTCRPK